MMNATASQLREAFRIANFHRNRANLNRRYARTYAQCGCDVLARHAARVARMEAEAARDALQDVRVFRAIAMLED